MELSPVKRIDTWNQPRNKIQTNIVLHCGTNVTNDDSEPQNIAKEILELAKSKTKDCNSNVTVSGIVPRYGKLNKKVRFVKSSFTN